LEQPQFVAGFYFLPAVFLCVVHKYLAKKKIEPSKKKVIPYMGCRWSGALPKWEKNEEFFELIK